MASHRPLQSAVLAEAWEAAEQLAPARRLHLMAEGELRSGNMNVALDWSARHQEANVVVGGRRFAAPTPDVAAAMHRAALGRRTNWCAYHHDGRPEWPAFWIKAPDHTPIRLLHDISRPGHIQITSQPYGRNAWINPIEVTLPADAHIEPADHVAHGDHYHLIIDEDDQTITLASGRYRDLEQLLNPLNHWLTGQRTIEPETPMANIPVLSCTTTNGDWNTAILTIGDEPPITVADRPGAWLQHTIDGDLELNVLGPKAVQQYLLDEPVAPLIYGAIVDLITGRFTNAHWTLLSQRIAAAGWEAIHRYSGHITFDPTQAAPPTLPKETWDVWDGMNTDIRTDALYVVSGQRLANILADRRVLNNLRNGGSERIDGKTYYLADVEGLLAAFRRFVEAHTLDEPDDDDGYDGDLP